MCTDVPIKGEEGVVCTDVPIKGEKWVVRTHVPIKGEEGVFVLSGMRGVAINEDKYVLPYMDINTNHVPYIKTSC